MATGQSTMNDVRNSNLGDSWSWDDQIYQQTTDLFHHIKSSKHWHGDTTYLIPAEDGLTAVSFTYSPYICKVPLFHLFSIYL